MSPIQTVYNEHSTFALQGSLPDLREYTNVRQALEEAFYEEHTVQTGPNSAEQTAVFDNDIIAITECGGQLYYHAQGRSSQQLDGFDDDIQKKLQDLMLENNLDLLES